MDRLHKNDDFDQIVLDMRRDKVQFHFAELTFLGNRKNPHACTWFIMLSRDII